MQSQIDVDKNNTLSGFFLVPPLDKLIYVPFRNEKKRDE